MKVIIYLLFAVNILLVKAYVTFKVIAISDIPILVVDDEKYEMELDEYPIYKFTLDVEPPVTYHYILGDNEESFDRVANGNTLNEFFDRQITVKIHPLLPLAFNESSIQKKSKLYDDTHVDTILIEAPQEQIDNLHESSSDSIKYKDIKVFYVSPYNVKVFNNVEISISGQSTVYEKKLSYKLNNLKTDDDKSLYGVTAIKLRGEQMDPSMIREKLYFDMLNALGVPTAQGKFVRVFINKKSVGLFLVSDDLNNSHFLRNTYNNGEKFESENHIFKSDCEVNKDTCGNLEYYGETSDKYEIYTYKGEENLKKSNVSKEEKIQEILVPLLYDITVYPATKKLNLDIESFLKAMALEFAAYGSDNYWISPGNFFLFKDVAKDYWYFLDSDFHTTFGSGGNPSEAIKTTLENYIELAKWENTARPLLDNLRKVSSNEKFLKEVLKQMISTFFNVEAVGPRIDSLAELIREDVYWDYQLERMNKGKVKYNHSYTTDQFEIQVSNSTDEVYPRPLKQWIIERAENIADELDMEIPSSVNTTLGYYKPKYEKDKKSEDKSESEEKSINNTTLTITTTVTRTRMTTIMMSSTKNYLPTSYNRCGRGIARCAEGWCCNIHGFCGKTEYYCGQGCQSEFGRCDGDSTSSTTNTTIISKECGQGIGSCPEGSCCSQYGTCGINPEHCGRGCQSEFGRCDGDGTPTAVNITGTPIQKATTTPTQEKCGQGVGKCEKGFCCSKYGYCGISSDYCGQGCQSEFGLCDNDNIFNNKYNNSTLKSSSFSKPTRKICGQGIGKCNEGFCCSKYGYCGTSSDHCGQGCQSEFGRCDIYNASATLNNNPLPTSYYNCGAMYGQRCADGWCCSANGYCGKTEFYCGNGCQKKYGKCN